MTVDRQAQQFGVQRLKLIMAFCESYELRGRGHYSKLFGVNDLEQTSYGADVVLSKGFAMFTPYIGIGAVAMEGKYTGPLALGLDTYSDTSPRYFGGLLMTITLLQITADIEYLEEPVYSLKVGLGW